MATSPARKAKAAAVRRNGGTQQKAADAARVSLRTVKRWEQEPDFQAMLYAQGILQAGPIRILADASAALHDTPSDESMLWVALGRRTPDGDFIPPEVLGTLVVKDAKFLRVVFVMPKDAGAVRAQLEAHVFPLIEDARTAVLMPSGLQALQDPDELRSLCRLFCAPTRVAFGEWLRLWRFKAGETKDVRTLEALWEGQSILADVISEHPATFALKARKLGETTICVAFAGYCARVRGANERVHLFSYRERAAIGLLSAVKFGLESLPAHLRLPITRETLKELEYDLGNDDVRTVVSYPTSENTAVEETATHTLMDEFADWPRNEQTYGSLEPTFTAPGATCHIITTGKGPADWSAAYWRECKSGDGLHYPIFIPATARPDRDEAWMAAKRKTMTAASFKVEYALAEEDALAGTAGYKFNHEDIDLTDAPTLQPVPMYHCPRRCRLSWRTEKPQARCPRCKSRVRPVRYIKSWDIGGSGKSADASVGTVIDCAAGDITPVVEQRRFQGIAFPSLSREIEQLDRDYPGPTVIEATGIGSAVIGHVNCPVNEFKTTGPSKVRIIENVAMCLENQTLKFSHAACPTLAQELRAYQEPDDYCETDCVMSLAIGLDSLGLAFTMGTLLPPFHA